MIPKIFVCADWYLPGRKAGGAVTALVNLIELLGEEFRFYVFTRDRDLTETSPYSGVPFDQWVPVGKAQVLYTADLSLRNLRRRIRELAADVIYLNSFFSRFTMKTLLLRRLGLLPATPIVLDPRGEFSPGALNLKRFRKWIYLKTALRAGLCRDLLWQASSSLDKERMGALVLGNGNADPACVQIARNVPSPLMFQEASSLSRPEKRPGTARFVFLSRISRMKNLHFALDVLASVSGQVEFDIYGPADDSAYWKACCDRIRTMPGNIVIKYGGPVPYEDVSHTLARYDFLLLPTLGENFGYAILEALAAGCPVLISDQTPWSGLESAGAGWELPLSDRQRWQAIVKSCMDMGPETYADFSERARRYACQWASSTPFYEEHLRLFRKAMASKAALSASEQSIPTF